MAVCSTISMFTFLCVILTHSTSQYTGVSWIKRSKKWRAYLYLKRKFKEGGTYDDALDAAKRVNQMCDEFQIERKNPNIDALPNHKTKRGISTYYGVIWNAQNEKWVAIIYKDKERFYGGCFDKEIEAAKAVNQLCDELEIPRKNDGVDASHETSNTYKAKPPPSEYRGVSWTIREKKWAVQVCLQKHTYFGGYFQEEIEAAKKVNQLCDELGIEPKNRKLDEMMKKKEQEDIKKLKRKRIGNLKSKTIEKNNTRKRLQIIDEVDTEFVLDEENHTSQEIDDNELSQPLKDKKVLADYDAVNKELEKLIKILDENSDPAAACTIKNNLITALNYPEQSILMTDINLRTKNNESALSISAKHGFANLIQFLISRGAEKEHFTNEFQTPLSLAVSHNHLNVVEVLFEQSWISPNSHTEPQFLHLSPIFNVKSREIAQLLVENDAVTHALYNHKNQSPLTIACQNGYLDVVEFFLEDGLDINHFDNDNKTPIFYADANGHHDIVNFLISEGAQTTSRLLFDNFKVQ